MPESLTRRRNGRGASLDLAKSLFSSGHRTRSLSITPEPPFARRMRTRPCARKLENIMQEPCGTVSEAASKSSFTGKED